MANIPIIVAGSGRSGTTWVLDALGKANNLRTIFEPLHPIGVNRAKPFANQYVRNESDNLELKQFMDEVFSGKIKSLWANFRIRPDRLSFSNLFKQGSTRHKLGTLAYWYNQLLVHYLRYHRQIKHNKIIVKFIRANLMAGWFLKQYKAKIVFIMRHPCAVVASKLQIDSPDWEYDTILRQYVEDINLNSDYLHKYNDILSYDTLSPAEAHTVIWCIENMIPLHDMKKNEFCLVFYENLILNGQKEWQHIADFFGLYNTPGREMLLQPSQQASFEMRTNKSDQDLLGKWKKNLNKREINEIENILNFFEVPYYNTFDSIPIKNIYTE